MIRKIRLNKFGDNPITVFYFSKELPLWIQGTIVDIETRGLYPDNANLTALGLIKGNKLSAFVIHPDSEELLETQEAFLNWASQKVHRCPRPLIAYYKIFEERWLDIPFDLEIQPNDNVKKRKSLSFYHLYNTPNEIMMEAAADEIMFHLVADLFEELALYCTLSHQYRSKEFRIGSGIGSFNDAMQFLINDLDRRS